MLSFTDAEIVQFVGQYFWPLIRITAFFMASPIFGARLISARVRVVLAVAITIIISPSLPPVPAINELSLSLFLLVMQQVLIGVALGFAFQIVFHVFILAGQYIAMKLGLSFASMNDPASGVSVTVISQFYMLTTTLLFLSINGHLVLIQILIDSFFVLPISNAGVKVDVFYRIIDLGGWMFGSALTISLPVLTALLVVNIAFGVMSRSAPQMNVFTVGFPITLIFGLLIMWIGFSALLPTYKAFVDQGFLFTQGLLK